MHHMQLLAVSHSCARHRDGHIGSWLDCFVVFVSERNVGSQNVDDLVVDDALNGAFADRGIGHDELCTLGQSAIGSFNDNGYRIGAAFQSRSRIRARFRNGGRIGGLVDVGGTIGLGCVVY